MQSTSLSRLQETDPAAASLQAPPREASCAGCEPGARKRARGTSGRASAGAACHHRQHRRPLHCCSHGACKLPPGGGARPGLRVAAGRQLLVRASSSHNTHTGPPRHKPFSRTFPRNQTGTQTGVHAPTHTPAQQHTLMEGEEKYYTFSAAFIYTPAGRHSHRRAEGPAH